MKDFISKKVILTILSIITIVIVGGTTLTYYLNGYLNSSSLNTDYLSHFGGFVGGLLGPILTFIATVYLINTYHTQKDELKLQRQLIAQQQFESTFFNMLNVHRELKNNLSINNSNEIITGTNVFKIIINNGGNLFSGYYFKNKNGYITAKLIPDQENGDEIFQNKFYEKYDLFYKEYQFILNHYCTNIYHILKFINENEEKDESKIKIEKYKKYADIFKSQLDINEMSILKMTIIHINEENNNLDIIKLIKHYNFLSEFNNSPEIKTNRKFYTFDIK